VCVCVCVRVCARAGRKSWRAVPTAKAKQLKPRAGIKQQACLNTTHEHISSWHMPEQHSPCGLCAHLTAGWPRCGRGSAPQSGSAGSASTCLPVHVLRPVCWCICLCGCACVLACVHACAPELCTHASLQQVQGQFGEPLRTTTCTRSQHDGRLGSRAPKGLSGVLQG